MTPQFLLVEDSLFQLRNFSISFFASQMLSDLPSTSSFGRKTFSLS